MKRGDLVRAKYYTKQYDAKLHLKEMEAGSVGIIVEVISGSPDKQMPAIAQVFVDGHTWKLKLDYFERVEP